jgi:arylsulfatase A-like enzyme
MVHVPLYVSEKFAGKSGAGVFGDVVMELDWSVGEIVQAIKQHNIQDRTLVVFTSDNGPWLSYGEHAGSAKPLREGKGTMFEGGCRVPTIAWWPGKIPAGSSCDELAATIDLLPTISSLTGTKLPDHVIDGKDISPLLFGEEQAKSPHSSYAYYYNAGRLQAVRDREWKLHFPHHYRTLSGRPGGQRGKPVRYDNRDIGLELFNLKNDLGETTNVADQHPAVVAHLSDLADAVRADLGDKLQKIEGSGIRGAARLEEPAASAGE